MLTIKFRTSVAVLAAALSVAVATGPIAPGANAHKNDGTANETAKKAQERWCEDLWSGFEGDVNNADAADKAGDTKGRDYWLDQAAGDIKMARESGCGWAARVRIRDKLARGGNYARAKQ